ncbi:UNKNOWN [Stylonychia lemnae]|uniref:Uncharacterized protein n=1 Tax=Stylonychia lemnae TaxID=5949 RepID=A0A078AMQ1_STYLE|nr:UNKNOWN [Stylonychia lemnae]|eukprot:CDW82657.1 UNKNOWN [Stylonychia lemnae]
MGKNSDLQPTFNQQLSSLARDKRKEKKKKQDVASSKTFDKTPFIDSEQARNLDKIMMNTQSKSFMNSPKLDKVHNHNKTFIGTDTLKHQYAKKDRVFSQTQESKINQGTTNYQQYQLNYAFNKNGQQTPQNPSKIEHNSIVINKPIVIQFQNKKITFVNNQKSSKNKNTNKTQMFYQTAAQRSPRNQSQQHYEDHYSGNNSTTNNGQIVYPKDLVKIARSKNQHRANNSINGNKHQVNQILNQILQYQETNQKQEMSSNEYNNQVQFYPTVPTNQSNQNYQSQQQNQNNMNNIPKQISRTQDQRKTNQNNLDYSNLSSEDQMNMSFFNGNLNNSFALPLNQYRPKVQTGKKVILSKLTQKSQRVGQIKTSKNNPINYSLYQREIPTKIFPENNRVLNPTIRSNSKSNMQRQALQKLQTATNSLRNSFVGDKYSAGYSGGAGGGILRQSDLIQRNQGSSSRAVNKYAILKHINNVTSPN